MSWNEGGASSSSTSSTMHSEIVFTPSPQPSIPLTPMSLGSIHTDTNTSVDISPTSSFNGTWSDVQVPLNFGNPGTNFTNNLHLETFTNRGAMGAFKFGNLENFPPNLPNAPQSTHAHLAQEVDVKPDLATLNQLLTPTDSNQGSPLKSLQDQVNMLESFIKRPSLTITHELINLESIKTEAEIKCETPSSIHEDDMEVGTPSLQCLGSMNQQQLIGSLFPPLLFPSDGPQSQDIKPDCKPARLSVNGKRIGRPPGSRKAIPTSCTSVQQNNTEARVCEWNSCGRTFKADDEFYQHVSNHVYQTDKQSRFCHWRDCNKVKLFDALYQLNAHIRTHTKERAYVCQHPSCGKSYSRAENLKTHNRVHTGERPYKCSLCDKHFTNASDRSKHENRTHSTLKPYGCLVTNCFKCYTDPSSLRKHFIKCHPELKGQYRQYCTPTSHVSRRKVKVEVEDQVVPQLTMPVNNIQLPIIPALSQAFSVPQINQIGTPLFTPPIVPPMNMLQVPNVSQMFPTGFPFSQFSLNQATLNLVNLLRPNPLPNQNIQFPFFPQPTFPLPTPQLPMFQFSSL